MQSIGGRIVKFEVTKLIWNEKRRFLNFVPSGIYHTLRPVPYGLENQRASPIPNLSYVQ